MRRPLESLARKPFYPWFVVANVCIGAFMATVDAGIVNVAFPRLVQVFHQPDLSGVEWVSIAYLITLSTLLVVFGRLADLMGRSRLYTAGFVIFGAGSALCGLAPTLGQLIFFRVLQAVGAALLQANSIAIITAAVPASRRGRALGVQGMAQAAGLSVGPALGGVLLATLGWRYIFYVNVPVAVLGTVAGLLILPQDAPAKRFSFDFPGAVLYGGMLVLFLAAVSLMGTWSEGALLGALAGVLLLGWFFLRRERRARDPMVNLKLFRNPVFRSGNLSGLLSYVVLFAVLFVTPFYLEQSMHLPPIQTGLFLMAVPLAISLASPLAGVLSDRWGSRVLAVLGMAVSELGALGLAFVSPAAAPVVILFALFLVGGGMGIFTPPNNSSVMGALRASHLGVGGGLLNMMRGVGMSLGIAAGGTFYTTFQHLYGALEPTAGFRYTLLTVAVVAVLAAAVAARRNGPAGPEERGAGIGEGVAL
ncbi:MAG: MFS transporter [Thermaerobacter sp.]|nr:MFS transporter [Thermaerobacter sp.]